MKPFTVALLVLVAVAAVTCSLTVRDDKVSKQLKVRLSHGGGVIGKYETSHKGRGILSFYGVPYGAPPIGKYRFRSPRPTDPWTGFIKATDDHRMCPQPGLQLHAKFMNEDCLYLNVFTPADPVQRRPLPVMVFLHGGGFAVGSGGAPTVWPDYFLDHDVVFVSGNYRLGVLGFLSTRVTSGNFGLKDQVLLLEWVKSNIRLFNGDPNDVTLFGLNAGAASVSLHLLSPRSQGLFHRAILQSGTIYAPWALNNYKERDNLIDHYGLLLNCSTLACLRSKSVEDLVEAQVKLTPPNSMDVLFIPAIEPTGPEAIINREPDEYLEYHGMNVPVMIGSSIFEGLLLGRNEFTVNSTGEIAKRLYIEQMNHLHSVYWKKFSTFKERMDAFVTDAWFTFPLDNFVKHRFRTNSTAATYVYLHQHVHPTLLFDRLTAGRGRLGIQSCLASGADLFSLFPLTRRITPKLAPNELDDYMRDIMTEMWVNFASTGNPNSMSTMNFQWEPATEYPLLYLRMGNATAQEPIFGMERGFMEDRLTAWRQLSSIKHVFLPVYFEFDKKK